MRKMPSNEEGLILILINLNLNALKLVEYLKFF
jgi:hypothetical protein